jgi:Family of unknown function (DUF6338)
MPTDLSSFLLLLLFVAPGFLFARAYWRDLPRYYSDPNILTQTVSAIIASTAIHFLLLIPFTLVATFSPTFREWVVALLTEPLSATTAISPYNLLVITIYPIFSLLVGWYGGLWWQGRSSPPQPWWANLVAEAHARQQKVRLRVRLRNGEQYAGSLVGFFWIGSKETIYELTLTAILREFPDEPGAASIRLPGQTLLLLSSDILWIARVH